MKQNAGILFHGATMELSAQSAYDGEGRRKYLTRKEGTKFLEYAVLEPRSNALFCLTIYYTGCRISEALSLHASNLDEEARVVCIHSLKKRGRKEVRRIPIPTFLAVELRIMRKQDECQPFWNFSRTSGWRIIKRVMNRAGIDGIPATAKGLRHAFGVRSALQQIPVSLIQYWMGHADPATTAIYLEVKDEEERALIERTW